MIAGARKRRMTVWEIAEYFTDAFFADTRALSIVDPPITCKATDHIGDMIDLVKRLEERGLTYRSGGNVCFDTERFPGYGKLALLDRQNLRAGARIEVDEAKRSPRDFVLWFTKGKFEHQAMQWDSPWGRGYPGWHLECSAMSMKYLGESFDIHCGGGDHIPVHHTNEIAQSEGATGKPWVAYWLHGEFLVMPGRRMGKSEGNSVILKDVLDRGYDPMDYRYYLLGAHYRSQLAFTWQALDAAARGRKSLLSLLTRLARSASTAGDPGTLTERARARRDEIVSAMTEDLNAPKALGKLRDVLSDDDLSPNERVAVVLDVDAIFGLRLSESVNHQSDQQQKTARSEAPDSQTQALVERRDARARSADCPSRRVAKTGEHTEFSYGFPCGPWYNRPNAYNQLKGVRR